MVSLLFLVAVAVVLVRHAVAPPVEAVARPPAERLQDPRPGRYYTVRRHDTLEALARRFYRNPALWTTIARVNDIRHPRKLRAGTVLWIPAEGR